MAIESSISPYGRMKLYNKKLSSLEQLHREKVLLRYRRRQTNVADLNPLKEAGRTKVTPAAQEGLLGFAMQLMGSGSKLEMAMALGKPLLKAIRKRKSRKRGYQAYDAEPQPSRVKKIVKGLVITFVIGKAVQMSLRYVAMYRRRKALDSRSIRG
jgi:hypothetical protein